jgi:hypothetical protein
LGAEIKEHYNKLPWFELNFEGMSKEDWTTYDRRLGVDYPGERDYLNLETYGPDIRPDSLEGHVIIDRGLWMNGTSDPELHRLVNEQGNQADSQWIWGGSEMMLFEVEESVEEKKHSFQHELRGDGRVFHSLSDAGLSRSFGPKFGQENPKGKRALDQVKPLKEWIFKLKEETGLNFDYNEHYGQEYIFEDPTSHYSFKFLVPEMLSVGQAYTIDDQKIKDLRERMNSAKDTELINHLLSEHYNFLKQQFIRAQDPVKRVWRGRNVDGLMQILSDWIIQGNEGLTENLQKFPHLEKSIDEITEKIFEISTEQPSLDYDSLNVPVLRGLLKDRKLDSGGIKKELVSRLEENESLQEEELKAVLLTHQNEIKNYNNYQIVAIASYTEFPEFSVKKDSNGKWDYAPKEIINFKEETLPKIANIFANVEMWGGAILDADPRNPEFADFCNNSAIRTPLEPVEGQPLVANWHHLFSKTIPQIKEIGDLNTTQKNIIRREFSDFHFYDSLSSYGDLLSKNHWSSGEKRILSMFSRISEFHDIPGSTILVDEPELSLHIDWQTTLVTDISTALNEHNLLFATHSPSLIEGHISKVVSIPPSGGR